MKKKLFILICSIVFTIYSHGQVLDNAFASGGTLTLTNIGINGVALQPDGKILVVGPKVGSTNGTIIIMRITSNGNLDPTFGQQGQTELVGLSVTSIKVGLNGSFFINTSKGLIKFQNNGTLDSTFSTTNLFDNGCQGAVCISNSVRHFDLTSDGKIIMIYSQNVSNTPGGGMPNYFNNKGTLVRLNQNGSIDLTFGTNGMISLYNTTGVSQNELRVPLYGDLVIDKTNGYIYYTASNQFNLPNQIRIFKKLNSVGDTLWNFEEPAGGYGYGNIKHLNGSLFTSGFIYPKTHVRKLITTNPTLWEYFEIDNINTIPFAFPTLSKDFTMQSDGKIIQLNLRRFSETENYKIQLVRLNVDGTPETNFGTDGKFLISGDANTGLNWCMYDVNTDRLYVATNSYIKRYNQNLLSTNDLPIPKIGIYPNPVTNYLNFIGKFKTASIYNVEGRKIGKNYFDKIIDVSNLKEGIYFLRGIDMNGNHFSEKFIKK